MARGLNWDPNALANLAKCYQTIPPGIRKDVIIYLLADIAGVALNQAELVEAAKCYTTIPGWVQYEVQIYLLCSILNP